MEAVAVAELLHRKDGAPTGSTVALRAAVPCSTDNVVRATA